MNEASEEIQEHHVPKAATGDWAHLDPSRWWFASAGFPMIAATLGPIASAFSVLALVKPWRQAYPPGTDVETAPFIDDPAWLTAINAVQLVIALIANMALFLNMTRRLSFAIAQPVTIAGWYISAFALIALTSTGAGPLVIEPSDEFIWSQAFFYGIYSAVLYFLVSSLMVVTYAGAQAGRYPKDFMLTASQRTLMLQTIMFVLYLLLGALVFSKIEDWDYHDAVYWAAVTLFTVGFGDMNPETTLGQALLMPYALVGIISLGLVIGSIRSLVLDRGKTRLDARMVEKKRRRTIRRMTRQGKDDILVPIKDDPPPLSSVPTQSSALTEFDRREQEFKLMRKIQDTAARRRRWFAMGISTSTWLVLWLVGAKIFQLCEARYQGWNYFDGFYFAFVSLTTIGYGNLVPVSNPGRSFWVFWALLALPTMTVLISNAGETIVKSIRDATDRVATVTILPSEAGFKKDLKKLLRMLSFGVLFDKEEVEQDPPGFLGYPEHLRNMITEETKDDDTNQATMRRADADIEAEGASNASPQYLTDRALSDEPHSLHPDAATSPPSTPSATTTPDKTSFSMPSPTTTSPPQNNNKITFSPSPHPQHPRTPSHQTSHRPSNNRGTSVPRNHLPHALPTSKLDYHVLLIDEIRRVTQHLKHHPPRKYTFHEWAWYLRLIGEDEGDAGRHGRAALHSHAHRLKGKNKRRGRNSLREEGGDGEVDGGDGKGKAVGEGGGGGSGEFGAVVEDENAGGEQQQQQTQTQEQQQQQPQGDGNKEEQEGEDKEKMEKEEEKEAEEEDEPPTWSWVGSKSPLMGSQEEADWILERLIARLEDELKAVREGYHHDHD